MLGLIRHLFANNRKAGSLKILEISSYPPPRAGWGIRVYYLKREIERQGGVCEVLNIGKSRFLTDRDFIPCFGALDYLKKVLKYRLKGYLVHMHLNGDSPKGFLLTLAALIISALTLRRAVITFHAGPVQKYFPKEKAPLLIPMFKFIFKLSKFIICNEEKVKANITAYGVSSQKIYPIQAFSKQYLDFDRTPLPESIEQIFQKHYPIVVSYMFFRPEYFVKDLFRAFRRVLDIYPNAKLLILGDHNPEDTDLASYAHSCIQLAERLGIGNAIHFAGDLEHDTFLTILEKATVFFRTHIVDGVSSSVLEALTLGVPVVAVDNGIRPPQVLTYHNRDVEEMVRLLCYVIKNYENIRRSIEPPPIPDTIREEMALLRKAQK